MPEKKKALQNALSKSKSVADACKTYGNYLMGEVYNENPETHDKEFWQKSLAKIITANQMAADPESKREFPKDMPTLTSENTEKERRESGKKRQKFLDGSMNYIRDRIQYKPIYQAMTERMSNEQMWMACRNPEEFSKKLGRQMAHYEMAAKETRSRSDDFQEMARTLEGTGKKIGGNSRRYEAALEAIRNNAEFRVREEKEEDVYRNVQTVKDYLSDKAQVRKTQTGRTRFETCMKFLQQNMPPEEFSQYCDDINRQRGAQDVNHKDHISPEQFAPKRATFEIESEMRRNVEAGYQMTERDCAVIAAAHAMVDRRLNQLDPGNIRIFRELRERPIKPERLSEAADKMQSDPKFKEWFKTQTPESLNKIVKEDNFKVIGNLGKDLQGPQNEAAPQKQEQKASVKDRFPLAIARSEAHNEKKKAPVKNNPGPSLA